MHNVPDAAFHARATELDATCELAIATGRESLLARIGPALLARHYVPAAWPAPLAIQRHTTLLVEAFAGPLTDLRPRLSAPMRWIALDGTTYLREQPRDGRGRMLGRQWLASAELYLPADRAWFRSSIGAL